MVRTAMNSLFSILRFCCSEVPPIHLLYLVIQSQVMNTASNRKLFVIVDGKDGNEFFVLNTQVRSIDFTPRDLYLLFTDPYSVFPQTGLYMPLFYSPGSAAAQTNVKDSFGEESDELFGRGGAVDDTQALTRGQK